MHEQIVNLWELQEDTGCLQSADASYFLDQRVLSNKTPCVDRGQRIIFQICNPFPWGLPCFTCWKAMASCFNQ